MLVAENERPLRDALAALIGHEPGLELVGLAASADDAIVTARETLPDVALLAVKMPGGGGPRVAKELRALGAPRMIALSAYEDRGSVVEMLDSGAVGYLVKGTAPSEILEAIRRAVRGQASLSEEVLATVIEKLVRDVTDPRERSDLESNLADRRVLLGHLVTATEKERQRIASDIHDDSIQAITAASMRLQILRRGLEDPDQLTLLDELDETIRLSIDRLRHLIFELRPPVLDREGLAAALRVYLREAEERSPTRYRLDDRLISQPPEERRLILYRIAQEALTNVRKHASARTASVTLAERGGGYFVRISDDGIGFLTERLTAVPGHLGLAAMRERAELAGGWLRVASELGAGTHVEVWIPEAEPADAGPAHDPSESP